MDEMTNGYNCPQFKCRCLDICNPLSCQNCLNYICEYCKKFERCEKKIELDEYNNLLDNNLNL